MKKMLSILIGFIFILGSVGISAISSDETKEKMKGRITFDNDELDQSQTECDEDELIGYHEGIQLTLAQSFTPQKDILTRIYLFAYREISPYPFQLAIRSELNGENLTTKSISYTSFPVTNPEWIEFDFEDISVTAGKTYYMILSTPRKTGHYYVVGFGSHNQYPYGNGYYTLDWQEWTNMSDIDLCFKTYGKDYPFQVDVNGGITKVGATLTNNFGYTLENVQWKINVQGGFLNSISKENNGIIESLEDSNSETISIDDFIFGLGPIKVTVSVDLETGEKIIRNSNGLVVLFFIFI